MPKYTDINELFTDIQLGIARDDDLRDFVDAAHSAGWQEGYDEGMEQGYNEGYEAHE